MRLFFVFVLGIIVLVMATVASLIWLAPPCGMGRCELGARDRALAPFDVVPDPLRVTVMGTSLTARGTWPDTLQFELAACLGVEVNVTRVAKGGETSRWARGEIDAVIDSAPDILLIEYTINDADLRRRVTLAESAKNHREIIAGVQEAIPQARIALMTLNRAYYRRAMLRPQMRRYERQYDRLASELGLGRLDLLPNWQRVVREGGFASTIPDGVHPTTETAEQINVPAIAAYISASCAVE